MNKKQSVIVVIGTAIFTILISYVALFLYARHNEEISIYLSIFEAYPHIVDSNNILAVSYPHTCQLKDKNIEGLSKSTIKDFFSSNTNSSDPINLSKLTGKVSVVKWEENKSMHDKGILFAFKPPEYGLLLLSRVGFNADKTEAVLCITNRKGHYGAGVLYLLRKITGTWKVVEDRLIWIS
jgi:hypothetical protein